MASDQYVAAAVHAALNGTAHFVYTNEGTHQYGPAGWPSIPAGLDVVSLDGYGVCQPADAAAGFCGPANASEAAWHRAFYEARLYVHDRNRPFSIFLGL